MDKPKETLHITCNHCGQRIACPQGFLPMDAKSPVVLEYLDKHSYQDDTGWYLDGDDARYMNHSESPNVLFTFDSNEGVAAGDIKAGDELTANYFAFDTSAAAKFNKVP